MRCSNSTQTWIGAAFISITWWAMEQSLRDYNNLDKADPWETLFDSVHNSTQATGGTYEV